MLIATTSAVRFCSTCADDRTFEQPMCVEGHGGDCPEWCCLECGSALFLGPWQTEAVLADLVAQRVA